MTRVVVSPQANADIDDIFEHLFERAGILVVERYARDLRAIHERPEMFPAIGAPRPKLGSHARIAVLSPYLVIYDYTPNEAIVTIARVLDGRRNVTRRPVRT